MTFLFDQNLSPNLAKGLKAFGENATHLTDHLSPETIDTELFKYLCENDMILITRDENIHYNDAERSAIHQFKVGAFFLGGKNRDKWEIIEQVIRNWRKMKETAERENRPFAFRIRPNGTQFDRINI